MPRTIGALLGPYCSDSSQLFDLVGAGPDSVALVSRNCPCQVAHASGAPLHLDHPARDAAREAPAAAVAVVACPIDHSSLPHVLPWAALALVVVQMRMRTERELAGALSGRAAATAGMACLSLCNMRGGRERCVNRLLYRHLCRRRGAWTAGYCIVMSCL
jgi:hypothetical protein